MKSTSLLMSSTSQQSVCYELFCLEISFPDMVFIFTVGGLFKNMKYKVGNPFYPVDSLKN